MKKYAFILSCIALSVGAHAQQFYIKGGLGYDFAQAGQSFSPYGYSYNGSITNNGNNSSTYNYKNNVSFAAGLQGSFALGYMFTEHVGVELGLIGGLAPRKYNNAQKSDTGSGSNYTTSLYANTPILLAPQFVLQTGGTKFNAYARGGIVLPLSANLKEIDNNVYTQTGYGTVYDTYTSDLKTSFSLGFTAAMGIQYCFNDNVCAWAELNLLSMSLYVKEEDLTDFTENGTSYISQISASQKTVYFSKNFTSLNGTNQNINNSGQTILPSYSVPFSNIGIHAGIMYKFAKSSRGGNNHSSHGRPSSRGRTTEF